MNNENIINGNVSEFIVDSDNVGARIDKFLLGMYPDKTRTNLQKIIDDKNVTVNGKVVTKNYKLRINDVVCCTINDPVEIDIIAEDIPLDIVYEDDYVLVVNKPKGMVVHPAIGNYTGTLVNALMYHCKGSLSGINGAIRPGIVHRIDKNTSGLLMVAKNDIAHNSLSEQIKEHSFLREYEAVIYGNCKDDTGTIDLPIGRNKVERKKMCVTHENSREAITHFEVIQRYMNFTHMKFKLETGRTHQIRVHMAYRGTPIAGDDVYGHKKVITRLNGQCLHARKIGFKHPATGEFMTFTSDLPEYFTKFLSSLDMR